MKSKRLCLTRFSIPTESKRFYREYKRLCLTCFFCNTPQILDSELNLNV
jgi:hypothetical protein